MANVLATSSVSLESFPDSSPACPPFGWPSPRISFSLDDVPSPDRNPTRSPTPTAADFEFRLDDPVAMLPADELFSGGKLVPLHSRSETVPSNLRPPAAAVPSPDLSDPSPRAPTCSIRWRELLSLKKRFHRAKPLPDLNKPTISNPNPNHNPKFLTILIHRRPKSESIDSSLSLPLLRATSSMSLGVDREERRRIKPVEPAAGGRRVKLRSTRGASTESPRMNPAGKVVFGGLERSSSGGGGGGSGAGDGTAARVRVRVKPVLNVPVCTLGGGFAMNNASVSRRKTSGSFRKTNLN